MIVFINVLHFVKICQVLTILPQFICRGVANFGTRCIYPQCLCLCLSTQLPTLTSSLFNTRRCGLLTISCQCWGNSIGFRSDESTSSWPSWFTRCFTIQLQHILSMTVSLSLMLAVAGYDRPTSTHVVFHGWTNSRFVDRSFEASGPQLWHSLLARIRQPDNDIGEFRRQPKSFLFK